MYDVIVVLNTIVLIDSVLNVNSYVFIVVIIIHAFFQVVAPELLLVCFRATICSSGFKAIQLDVYLVQTRSYLVLYHLSSLGITFVELVTFFNRKQQLLRKNC